MGGTNILGFSVPWWVRFLGNSPQGDPNVYEFRPASVREGIHPGEVEEGEGRIPVKSRRKLHLKLLVFH